MTTVEKLQKAKKEFPEIFRARAEKLRNLIEEAHRLAIDLICAEIKRRGLKGESDVAVELEKNGEMSDFLYPVAALFAGYRKSDWVEDVKKMVFDDLQNVFDGESHREENSVDLYLWKTLQPKNT